MIVVILQVESNAVMFSPDKIEILMTILNARQTSLGIIVYKISIPTTLATAYGQLTPFSVHETIYNNCST